MELHIWLTPSTGKQFKLMCKRACACLLKGLDGNRKLVTGLQGCFFIYKKENLKAQYVWVIGACEIIMRSFKREY